MAIVRQNSLSIQIFRSLCMVEDVILVRCRATSTWWIWQHRQPAGQEDPNHHRKHGELEVSERLM